MYQKLLNPNTRKTRTPRILTNNERHHPAELSFGNLIRPHSGAIRNKTILFGETGAHQQYRQGLDREQEAI